MNVACIDLEGVLAPEMWPYIGSCFGIPGLQRTTREEPDYYSLMLHRIMLLRKHNLTLDDVQNVVGTLAVYEQAAEFLDALRYHFRIVIVSDAFVEFAAHFCGQLGAPELQCHALSTDGQGYIESCVFLPRQGKEETVRLLQKEGNRVLAIGDAFNDLAMLAAADNGFLFKPSPETRKAAGSLRIAESYGEILQSLQLGRMQALLPLQAAAG
jgi:phosphoserine/homoserine phosphotransferase